MYKDVCFIGHYRIGEYLFSILLHHGGLLADINAIQELSDVFLSDCGGLLDQRRCEKKAESYMRAGNPRGFINTRSFLRAWAKE